MMILKDVLNHKPYFEEWTKDVYKLYENEFFVIEALETIIINCKTLKEAMVFIGNEIDGEWNIDGNVELLNDLTNFLTLYE